MKLIYQAIALLLLSSCLPSPFTSKPTNDGKEYFINFEIENNSNSELRCEQWHIKKYSSVDKEDDFFSFLEETTVIPAHKSETLYISLYTHHEDFEADTLTSFKVNIFKETEEIKLIGLPAGYLTNIYDKYSLGYVNSSIFGLMNEANLQPKYKFISYKMTINSDESFSIIIDEEKSTLK